MINIFRFMIGDPLVRSLDSYKVLLIEDFKPDQLAFERWVNKEDLPYDYEIADSVAEAESILSDNEFDVLLADYSLGDGTAMDILEDISDTPVIIITGTGNESIAAETMKSGAYDYIIKDDEHNYLEIIHSTLVNAVERRKNEVKLRRLSRAIKHSPAGITITDIDGVIEYANPQFLEMFGLNMEDTKGSNIENVSPNLFSENIISEIGDGISFEESCSSEVNNIDNESTFSVSISPVKNQDGEVIQYIFVAKDITERKRVKDREEFLHSLLRHDLKNKIQVADGYHEILLDKNDLVEENRETLKKARKSLKEGKRLIKKVKTLKEVNQEDEKQPIYLNNILNQIITEEQSKAEERGIEIIYKNEKKIKVIGGSLIKEAFRNIIGNSIKHSNGSKIEIKALEEESKVNIVISDDGRGIPDDLKEKIFDKGFKNGQSSGSGIGMYIVDEILKNYDGEIKVEDSEMGGAKFKINLQKP